MRGCRMEPSRSRPAQIPGSVDVGPGAGRGQHPRALRRRRRHFAAAPPPPSCDRGAVPDSLDGSLGWIPGTALGKGNRGEGGPLSLRGHKRSPFPPFLKERGQPSPVAVVLLSQPGFEGKGGYHIVSCKQGWKFKLNHGHSRLPSPWMEVIHENQRHSPTHRIPLHPLFWALQ